MQWLGVRVGIWVGHGYLLWVQWLGVRVGIWLDMKMGRRVRHTQETPFEWSEGHVVGREQSMACMLS